MSLAPGPEQCPPRVEHEGSRQGANGDKTLFAVEDFYLKKRKAVSPMVSGANQRGAKRDALEQLVEHKSRRQGADGAGAGRDAERDANDDGVRRDAIFQHLRHRHCPAARPDLRKQGTVSLHRNHQQPAFVLRSSCATDFHAVAAVQGVLHFYSPLRWGGDSAAAVTVTARRQSRPQWRPAKIIRNWIFSSQTWHVSGSTCASPESTEVASPDSICAAETASAKAASSTVFTPSGGGMSRTDCVILQNR